LPVNQTGHRFRRRRNAQKKRTMGPYDGCNTQVKEIAKLRKNLLD